MKASNKSCASSAIEHTHSKAIPSTTFGLLRHGQTLWNSQKKIQGLGDSPLTEKGREQTGLWLQTLRKYAWDRIIASDLGRVQETVAILNRELQLPIIFDPRLREQGWGQWEGLTIPAIKANFKEELALRVAMGWQFSAPGGETRQAVKDRALATLLQAAENWPGQKILVVCHQGIIKTVLYHITGRAFRPEEDPLLHHDRFHLISLAADRFTPVALNISPTGEP